jgi:hypothetical protein
MQSGTRWSLKGLLGTTLLALAWSAQAMETLDVLVLYDTASQRHFNGQPATAARNWVDQTNTMYRNSRMNIQLRLVGVEAHNPSGSTMSQVLNAIRNDRQVRDRRDALGADFVAQCSGLCETLGSLLYQLSDRPGDTLKVEYRGEVANLSRNVVVESAEPDGIRGHTMYHRDSAGAISYAEFRHLGKKGVLGRYALHYHLCGDTMRGSYVLGASIWDSHNRWLTIHGTNYLVVRDNVGYRSVGHGFFLEDGTDESVVVAYTVFQVVYADGSVMIDAGMALDLAGPATFWSERHAEVQQALEGASLIVVTHEHHDHVDGVVRSASPSIIRPKTVLTWPQVQTLIDRPNVPQIQLDSPTAQQYLDVHNDL